MRKAQSGRSEAELDELRVNGQEGLPGASKPASQARVFAARPEDLRPSEHRTHTVEGRWNSHKVSPDLQMQTHIHIK